MHVEDFTGRGASVKGLCEAFLAGAPPHATLLLGPFGVGKRSLAHILAQSLHCTGPLPKPCGSCPPCKRYLGESHPDAYCLPEKKRTGVDEIRDLIAALQTTAYEGGWRSVVLEAAGSLTPQAQNSLLKTLEEAPERTVFLLTAVSGSQLLPTVRSRCRIVQMPPLSPPQVEQALLQRQIAPGRAAELAALSGGSIGEALALDADTAFWSMRERLHGAIAAIRGPADVVMAVAALKDDKTEASRACDVLESTFRETLAASLRPPAAAGTLSSWQRSLVRMGPRALTAQIRNIMEMRRMLSSNVAWQTALERFLLEYSEEIQAWQS